jgi:radical SAM superfamily enzyme YgiQ (UPF0313 family)
MNPISLDSLSKILYFLLSLVVNRFEISRTRRYNQAMYDFPPYRPPSEANSALIRVTRGCPWNHCTFCGMYKDIGFEFRPLEPIKEDIGLANELFPLSRTVFIGDSEILLHPDIVEIVALIRETLPSAERLTAYARAHTLARLPQEKLNRLKKAGLSRLHVGLESGDLHILKSIRKGATPDIMIRGGQKARASGFELCFYVLCGIGGEDNWRNQADGTAEVINRVNPDFIRLRTLSLVSIAPLFESWQSGRFTTITPLSRLKETRRLIEKLELTNCELASDHVTNYLWAAEGIIYRGVDGRLPMDKENLLAELDEAIKRVSGCDDILDANMLVQQGVIRNL